MGEGKPPDIGRKEIMTKLEALIEQAEASGLIFLDDIVNYVKEVGIGIQSGSIIKPLIYRILCKKDRQKPSLAETIDSIIE